MCETWGTTRRGIGIILILDANPGNGGKEKYSVADPGSGAFLIPGSGMGKKSGSASGIWIRDEKPGSYF
jgi:hypothetical protein